MMPILKKIILRHRDTTLDTWTTIAPGIRLLKKHDKTRRAFSSPILTFAEDHLNMDLLQKRLGSTEHSYLAPSVFFCEIESGFISPRLQGLPRYWLVGNEGHYIEDFLFSNWKKHIPPGMKLRDTEDPDIIDVDIGRPMHFNQPILFMNFFKNTNHLLHESLPTLLYLKEVMNGIPDYLIYSSPLNTAAKQFLHDIGFPVHKIIEGSTTAISAPRIILCCFGSLGHLNTPTVALDHLSSRLTKMPLKSCPPGETPTRIFVSRSDASKRLLIDEQAITDYLINKHGFKVVVPGLMSIAQQIEYFSNASIVVGPHGMGINNFIFATAPKLLMELFQPNWVREAYCRQAQIKSAAYAAYIGKTVHENLSVDITSFIAFFEKCLAGIEEDPPALVDNKLPVSQISQPPQPPHRCDLPLPATL